MLQEPRALESTIFRYKDIISTDISTVFPYHFPSKKGGSKPQPAVLKEPPRAAGTRIKNGQ